MFLVLDSRFSTDVDDFNTTRTIRIDLETPAHSPIHRQDHRSSTSKPTNSSGAAQLRLQPKTKSRPSTMFSTWDFVRPRHWYPMSTLEQSMMELDYMADRMLSGMRPSPFYYDQPVMPVRRQPAQVLRAPFRLEMDDDEFFRDLPVSMRPRQSQAAATLKQTEQPGQQPDQPAAKRDSRSEHADTTTANPEATISEDRSPQQQQQQQRAFSSYSFSSSSILDENGQRVVSTRRRYEDSTGRLKAMHEREVGDKKLRTVWSRAHQDDEGKHESVCSSGNAEDFEKLWASTPFGVAQQKSLADADQGQAQVQGGEEQAKALRDGDSKGDDASMEQP